MVMVMVMVTAMAMARKNRIINTLNILEKNNILLFVKNVLLTGSVQVLIQIVTLLCGILVIRNLSVHEYAYYTVANSMLAAMSILTDSGITSGALSIAGKNWSSSSHLGRVLNTAVSLRKRFALLSWAFVLPIVFYLLKDHGASVKEIILIIISMIPFFFTSISTSLYEVSLKLNNAVPSLQFSQLIAATGRLLLLTIILIFPHAFVALAIVVIPQYWVNQRLKGITQKYVDWHEKIDFTFRNQLISIVKRLFPEGLYNCLSGQLTIWIVALLGSTSALAELGALTRFSVALRIIGTIFTTLISPNFSKLPDNQSLLNKRYISILIGTFLVFPVIILVASFFSKELLSILGSNYSNLDSILVLVLISGSFEIFTALCLNLNNVRGWALNPLISIPVNIVVLITSIYFLHVSTLKDALSLSIISSLVQIIMHVSYGVFRIRNIREVSNN